jgi:hypothetical protein
VTLYSVVFRFSGQDLTTTGTYIETTSRLTEPDLLGLAVLAIRNPSNADHPATAACGSAGATVRFHRHRVRLPTRPALGGYLSTVVSPGSPGPAHRVVLAPPGVRDRGAGRPARAMADDSWTELQAALK